MQSLATAYPDWLEEAIKLRSVNQFIRDIEQYEASHEEQLLLQIRKAHHIVLARTIYDDLKSRIGLPEVFSNMSDLADQLVQLALKAHTKWLVERFGHPTNDDGEIQELHIVAMGKLGGGELNVSSDIDLIFTYPDQGKTNGDDPISSYEFFSKLAKKIIHALAFPNQHGFSFRVDTRLRPFGDSGPLVCNHSALEQYLYSHGRAWERYAWIKARVITGDKKDSLKNIYEPFVYRKHVDFTSIDSLRKLRTEISIAASRIENDLDIKIGTGGIREIEFIAQLFQLMRGGTDVNLRDQSTLATLQKLNEKKLLAPETVKDLSDSYRFLRTLEHRIQYLDNAQTHQLPKDPNDQALLAESMGYITWDELLKRTKATRSTVNRHFKQIFSSEAQEGLSDITPITLSNVDEIATLNNLSKKQGNVSPVKNFLQSGKFRRLSAHSQSKIELLLPYFLKDARELDHDISYPLVKGVIEILEAIGGIDSYLSLLIEFPNVRKRLLELVERSSWA
ncbi:MAG: bifunctional [glutamate--ammonia ligase]-adenylyl-L-tyrosine phosphorylase/[glutamate--ammonia-ligase] adenylyltransferase, partial [Betaproteobacteria bacterium]